MINLSGVVIRKLRIEDYDALKTNNWTQISADRDIVIKLLGH